MYSFRKRKYSLLHQSPSILAHRPHRYLAVDYQHSYFNLSRAAFPEPLEHDIQNAVKFIDRPTTDSQPLWSQMYLDNLFQVVFRPLWAFMIPLLVIFILHVVFPSALSVTKKSKLRQRRHQQETLWIALHVDYQSRHPSIAEHHATENSTSLFLLRCLTYVPQLLNNRVLRPLGQLPFGQMRSGDPEGADVTSPLVELNEQQSQTRIAAEERRKRQAQRKQALRRAFDSGKKVGQATFNSAKSLVAPLATGAAYFAFNWSNFLADFKERDARRRAARRRGMESTDAIDL